MLSTLPASLLLVFLLVGWYSASGQVTPLPNAHAHNDYEHGRPLLDALDQGFLSVEADIHLVNGELYVSHNAPDLAKAPTLKNLYLEPLKERVKRNGNRVYANSSAPLLLLIDIKTEAETTYQVLRKQLAAYQDLLVQRVGNQLKPGAVQVVISGNRPIATVLSESTALVFLDGRPNDLKTKTAVSQMPLISAPYKSVLQWIGQGKIPPAELTALKTLADATHGQGKKLRLWASPEDEKVWTVLLDAGVDFLNTDSLSRLRLFLINRKSQK